VPFKPASEIEFLKFDLSCPKTKVSSGTTADFYIIKDVLHIIPVSVA